MDKEIAQFLENQIPYLKILKEWISEPEGSSSGVVKNEIIQRKI